MKDVLDAFVAQSREILKDSLCGVYLHGSAVMGCFNPQKSDLDLIVVVSAPPTDAAKRAFLDMTAELNASAPEKGIEMSIVRRDVLKPFVYPTPYELHFSAGYLDWYRDDPKDYIEEMHGTDKDLAAHCTVIRARGKCLYGPPIDEVFGEVPQADYMDSIWFDVENAREEITTCPMYLTLNLARVLAYCKEGTVLSKKEGGAWALSHVPAAFHPLIQAALREYTEGETVAYDAACAERYADYMLQEIQAAYPACGG